MDKDIIISADAVALFCRMQMNVKRDLPIRPSEMGVLIFTQKQMGPVTPLMISHFFRIAKPSVTSMVNALIKKEYLVKTPSAIDGRSYTVSATDKGAELVESTYNEYFKTMELLREKMGVNEFNLFIQLIQTANNILSEEK
ncbi:MAG: transcriptional regulator, MarR family [Clostridia bacterium]|jgi:DNA-binding MarR family transcriptional regulator|nr:transcriptional regulator, MarR family [Clostridia bacterium]